MSNDSNIIILSKTGYSYGNPYKPKKKSFPYHGINLDCKIPPELEPFDEEDTKEEEESEWELLYFVDTVSWYELRIPVVYEDFLPTDQNDTCYWKAADGKRRVYCAQLYCAMDPEFGYCQANWAYWYDCTMQGKVSGASFLIGVSDFVNAGNSPYSFRPLISFNPCATGSWAAVYRSKTGAIPTGPFPFTIDYPPPWL